MKSHMCGHNCIMIKVYVILHSQVPVSIGQRSEGDCLVKRLFLQNVTHNTNLLHTLGKGSPAILFPRDFIRRNFPELHNGNNIPYLAKTLILRALRLLRTRTFTLKKMDLINVSGWLLQDFFHA